MTIYGPTTYEWQGETYTQAGYYAGNRYDAAMFALGYSRDTIGGLDVLVRAKLSNEGTGGKFYEFAQLWNNPPTDGYGMQNPGFWSTAYGVYGAGHVWYAEYSRSLAASAKEDADAVMRGADIGGGSGGTSSGDSGEVDGDSVYFTVDQFTGYTPTPLGLQGIVFTSAQWESVLQYQAEHNPDGHLFLACGGNDGNYFTVVFTTYQPSFSGNQYSWGDNSLCTRIVQKSAAASFIVDHGGKKYYRMQDSDVNILNTTNAPQYGGVTDACRPCYGWYYNGPSSDIVVPLTTIKSEALLDYGGQTYGFGAANYDDFPYRFAATFNRGFQKSYQTADYKWVFVFRKYQNGSNLAIPTVSIYRKDGFSLEFNDDGSAKKVNGTSVYNRASGATNFTSSDLKDGFIEKTVVGNSYGAFSFSNWTFAYAAVDGDKLDNDPIGPPLPPNNWPEPTDEPTTPDPPEVHEPTEKPVYPPETNYPDVTYVTADLSAVLDAMNEHCEHIQHAIYDAVSGLYDNITDYLGQEYYLLRSELHENIGWLYDELDEIDRWRRYNMERVIMAIQSLDMSPTVEVEGGGDTSTIEQQLEDIKGKLDALLLAATIDAAANVAQAIMGLITGLLTMFGNVLGALKDAMGELSSVFPFSLPWDLAAIAALFAADPVTPVFDLTVPAFGQVSQPTAIHVDLHDWDGVAAVVRSGELVLFATDLIMRTRDMMGVGSDDVA